MRKRKGEELDDKQEFTEHATLEGQPQNSSCKQAKVSLLSDGLEGHIFALNRLMSDLDFRIANMHQLIRNLV